MFLFLFAGTTLIFRPSNLCSDRVTSSRSATQRGESLLCDFAYPGRELRELPFVSIISCLCTRMRSEGPVFQSISVASLGAHAKGSQQVPNTSEYFKNTSFDDSQKTWFEGMRCGAAISRRQSFPKLQKDSREQARSRQSSASSLRNSRPELSKSENRGGLM